MYLNRKKRFFNMIEVLLALAVIAIGMTSILGLFPVGLNASRQAVAENVSADVADQMIAYLRVMGESSPTMYDRTFSETFPYNKTCLPELTGTGSLGLNITKTDIDGNVDTNGKNIRIDLKSGTFDVEAQSNAFLDEYKAGNIDEPGLSANDFMRVAKGWAIFIPKTTVPNLRRRVYFITQGPNCTENGGNRNIDYSAMALVWKSTVQIQRDNPDGTGWGKWPLVPSYTDFGQLNIELSWPLVLPYAERKKRYYQIVINRP